MKCFRMNSLLFLVINYSRKNRSSNMFDMVLNALWIQNSYFCEDGVSILEVNLKKRENNFYLRFEKRIIYFIRTLFFSKSYYWKAALRNLANLC